MHSPDHHFLAVSPLFVSFVQYSGFHNNVLKVWHQRLQLTIIKLCHSAGDYKYLKLPVLKRCALL